MFPYVNPISPLQLIGTQSVSRDKTIGTNFSILSTGGFMEVFSIDQLYYTVPLSTYGQITYSGNSIPVSFYKGSGTTFSYDTLTLNSDNISSGRKKLGMLVYVKEEDQVYQFDIDNYESLWNSATGATGVGGPTVIISNFGTTVKANSPEGISFISGWTGNTVEGISGATRSNSVWKKYNGTNLALTGGSFNSLTGVLSLVNITGGTLNLSGFTSGGGGSITGGTIDYNTGTLSLNSTGGTVTITGFTDTYVTGGTYSAGTIVFTNNYGNTFSVTGLTTGGTSGTDVFVTGGTYSSGTATFTNNTGGTFTVTGFTTGGTISGVTNQVAYFSGTNDLTGNNNFIYTGQTLQIASTGTTSSDVPFRVSNTSGIFEVRGDGNSHFLQPSKLVYFGSNARISNDAGGQASLIQFDLFNCRLSNDFNANSFSIGSIKQASIGGIYDNNESSLVVHRIGTTPTVSSDRFKLWGADIIPGNTAPHFKTEGGDIIKLYTHSAVTTTQGIADALTTLGLLSASTIASGTDVFVTGGTYSSGTATFTNNTGGTFNVTGFTSGDTNFANTNLTFTGNRTHNTNGNYLWIQTSGSTNGSTIYMDPTNWIDVGFVSPSNFTRWSSTYIDTFYNLTSRIKIISNETIINESGDNLDFRVEGDTDQNLIFVDASTDNVGIGISSPSEKLDVSGKTKTINFQMTSGATNGYVLTSDSLGNASWQSNLFTGGTVSGATNFTGGISANTISATTYLNLPIDVFVTGGTYNDGIYNFTNNTGGTFNVSATTTYSAGVISGSTWTSTGTGQIILPEVKVALFNNSNFLEPIYTYTVSSGTTGSGGIPALTDNDTNYIVIEYSGGTPQYNVLLTDATINDSDVVLYMIVYRLNNFVHTLEFGNQGAGLPNKLNDRVIMTDRFARESGFSLGLSGLTGVVTLTAGVSWNGTYRQSLASVNSQDDIFFQNYHTGGTWTYSTSANTLNNLYYDDGTNPVLSSSGKYLVNWYFRGQEVNDHIYEVWGNDEYDTLSEAQLSLEPNLPELITSHAFLVGRIIVQYSATTGSVESAFVTYFQGSQVQSHNDLTGIQGGSAGQYYHLTSNEYLNLPLLNTNNVFQSGITATTISATTYQNYPTQTLEDTLGYGNTTGIYNIQMGTGTTINSDNGGGQISLDYGSIPNNVYITTDSGVGNETLLSLQQNGATFGSIDHKFVVKLSEANVSFKTAFVVNGTYSASTTPDVIRTEDNATTSIIVGSGDKPGILLGSPDSIINSGVTNTVVAGGNNITASTNNTLYSYNFNIFNTPTNNNLNTQILSRNTSTGDVEYTDVSILTGGTDVFVTGGTYNNNTFTYTNNTGGTFNVSFNSVTGLTSTGTISSATLSATTYQNYPTQDLATTLGYGNNTGLYDIEMASNRVIKTDNGGGQIDLDFGGIANQVFISTDSGIGAESFLRLSDSTSAQLGIGTHFFSTTPTSTDVNWSNGFSLNGKYNTNTSNDIIVSKDNGAASFSSATNDMSGVIISSYGSTINSGIRNVAIIAGSSVTASTSSTLYTNTLNLWVVPAINNTNTQVLTRNSTTGEVEYRTASSLDTFVTGVTYSANTLTVSQNQGQPNLTTTIGLKTKSGSVASGSFAGTPRTATVTFTTAFANTNYSIQITGSDNRTFTYQSKATTGFTINTNANSALTGNVDWIAIEHGES